MTSEGSGSAYASDDISHHYALQLLEDVERRKTAVTAVGLGFKWLTVPTIFTYSEPVEAIVEG